MATDTKAKAGPTAGPAADQAEEHEARGSDLSKDPNFIKHGSDQHAMILGLRKATAEDKYVHEGWTLQDITAFGPATRPEFLEATLVQRVNELKKPPSMPQSINPRKPNYAPAMWTPPEPAEG